MFGTKTTTAIAFGLLACTVAETLDYPQRETCRPEAEKVYTTMDLGHWCSEHVPEEPSPFSPWNESQPAATGVMTPWTPEAPRR